MKAAGLEAARERSELLDIVLHNRVARPKGAYLVTLARQWLSNGGNKGGRRVQGTNRMWCLLPRTDVVMQRELEESRASWLVAGSLEPAEEEMRILELGAVVALREREIHLFKYTANRLALGTKHSLA